MDTYLLFLLLYYQLIFLNQLKLSFYKQEILYISHLKTLLTFPYGCRYPKLEQLFDSSHLREKQEESLSNCR